MAEVPAVPPVPALELRSVEADDLLDLPARLDLDRLPDEANGIDVLDLAARAELLARTPHRDVHVGAQVALLHIAVAGAERPQD